MDSDLNAEPDSEPDSEPGTEQDTEPNRLKVDFDLGDSSRQEPEDESDDSESEEVDTDDDSEVEPEESVLKRGRGKQSPNTTESIARRGLGHPNPKAVTKQIDMDNHEDSEQPVLQLQRGRGRPRKQPQNTESVPRRGPGRPLSAATKEPDTDNHGNSSSEFEQPPLKRRRGRPRKQPQNTESVPRRGPGRPRKGSNPTEPDLIDPSDEDEDDIPDDIRAGIKDIGEKVVALCQDLAQKTASYTASDIFKLTRLAMGPISKGVRIQNKRSAWQTALKECKFKTPDEVTKPAKGASSEGRDGVIGSYQQRLEKFTDSEVRVGELVDVRKHQRALVKSLLRVVGSYILL
jgi:hypothetical protein